MTLSSEPNFIPTNGSLTKFLNTLFSVPYMFSSSSTGCGKSSTTLVLAAKDPTPSIFDVLMTATTYKSNTKVNNDM